MKTCKLAPATKDYVWGGQLLKQYGKGLNQDRVAEAWELSFHPDGLTLISSGEYKGKLLKDVVTPKDLGTSVSKFPFFPLLIKLIDSEQDLSVQVHPSDHYALKNENSLGKTEMWYIVGAKKGSVIYVGFKKQYSSQEIHNSLLDGTILNKLNTIKVKPDESYFIEAGTVHAIGKGITILEIQQNSNLTYRLFDYNRVDTNGNARELHLEKAMDVLRMEPYRNAKFKKPIIGASKYFVTKTLAVKESYELISTTKSFISVTILEGSGSIDGIPFSQFDTFFIPANSKVLIEGNTRLVTVCVK